MPDPNNEFLTAVLTNGFHLLKQFTQGIHLPHWLAPLSMLGALSALEKLLPAVQKGSLLAGIGSYVLIGILLVNLLAFSVFLYLPGQLITAKSSSVSRSGVVLLKLLFMGGLVVLKNVTLYSLKLIFDLLMLMLAALTYPPRQPADQIAAHC
ncbi:hypothetical protein [Acaryochloris sp. IP29b_bin.137]|uniref:hypothetical protein n=1 Tax=Acaryochloris sp. IP29b_bin.137 TaxID=2969217 RepID=UPI00261F99D9|nr:hypothetical protein [Acaryochloris sp. IP29b_bin.137]